MNEIKKSVANIKYLKDSGFFIFTDICFEINIRKEVPLISFKSKLTKIFFIGTVYHIDKGGCQA